MSEIGDNSGGLRRAAIEEINDALKPHRERARALRGSVEQLRAKLPIADMDMAQRATDLGGMFVSLNSDIDAAHDRTKLPYLQSGNAIDAAKAQILSAVEDDYQFVRQALLDWHTGERDRVDARRADEAAAQAHDPEPTAKEFAGGAVKVWNRSLQGDLGARSSLKKDLEITVTDASLIPEWVLEIASVREAIAKAVKPAIKAGTLIPGITSRDVDALRLTKG